MRLLTIILLLVGALMPVGYNPCSYGTASDGSHHYFDCEKKALPQWDFVWDQLFAYFGSATPQSITIEYWDGSTSRFRFVDEGFAETMGYVIAGQADWYRTYALAVAQQEMQQGRVSLAQVRDWSTYFGPSGSAASSRNWMASSTRTGLPGCVGRTARVDHHYVE